MKRIIWSNRNLNLEDWEDCFKELEEERKKELTESEKYDEMYELNNQYLEDERMNLNIQLDNSILVMGDLGLWDGRRQGYKIIKSGNIADILYTDCEYAEWYSDGYNIKSTQVHHDGTNYLLYREIKDDVDIDKFLDKIYNGEEITNNVLNKYTKSIAKYVKEVYGW
jgi:hypothetical protein